MGCGCNSGKQVVQGAARLAQSVAGVGLADAAPGGEVVMG